MLELKEATLTENGHTWFDNLSFVANEGQLTCVTGESGKTALVGVLLGFTPLTSGYVSIDGSLLTPLSTPMFRRLMAYVPQKRPVTVSQTEVDTEGLETVWSPYNRRRTQLTAIDEHLDVAPMAQKRIVIVDAPDVALLGTLKSLSNSGHTVVVTSQREEYLNQSDKILTLGKE